MDTKSFAIARSGRSMKIDQSISYKLVKSLIIVKQTSLSEILIKGPLKMICYLSM